MLGPGGLEALWNPCQTCGKFVLSFDDTWPSRGAFNESKGTAPLVPFGARGPVQCYSHVMQVSGPGRRVGPIFGSQFKILKAKRYVQPKSQNGLDLSSGNASVPFPRGTENLSSVPKMSQMLKFFHTKCFRFLLQAEPKMRKY